MPSRNALMKEESATPEERIRHLRHELKTALKHQKRKLKKQNMELDETSRHEWYSQMADSLLANPDEAPKGTSKVELVNVHTQKTEQLSLNPKFDALKNADLLYRKAKKGKRGFDIAVEKAEHTSQSIQKIENLLSSVDTLLKDSSETDPITDNAVESMEEKASELTLSKPGQQTTSKKEQKESVPYKKFTIDGWDVYLGKNSTQNDELSVKFAKPWDTWLHVAGHAGSHVVIKRVKNGPPPPSEVIRKAAQLAVWFSKARHTSYAEVHVTEARFVRKRRHAPPGEVIAERCKSVRVEPKNPQDMFPSGMYE